LTSHAELMVIVDETGQNRSFSSNNAKLF